jgi:hypothetical protein
VTKERFRLRVKSAAAGSRKVKYIFEGPSNLLTLFDLVSGSPDIHLLLHAGRHVHGPKRVVR